MGVPYRLGKDGKLYVSTPIDLGSSGTAPDESTLASALSGATEVAHVQDVNGNMTKDTIEFSTRANSGFAQTVGTLIKASVEFTLVWRPNDTVVNTLRTAFLNNTEVFAAALDQDKSVTGTQGLSGNFSVTTFGTPQPVGGIMTCPVTLTASTGTAWYKKTS